MRMLVSVRDADEARLAAAAAVDFIDLKEPHAGALGGLPPARIGEIARLLRASSASCTVSATIGDLPVSAPAHILARVAQVAGLGVDLVKVGVPGRGGEGTVALLERLAESGHAVVPVLIADEGFDEGFVERACALPFAALMADTQAKNRGSILSMLPAGRLERFIEIARAANMPVGLAGALTLGELPLVLRLAPDFAGFRSAVCDGGRAARLCPVRLAALAEAIRAPLHSSPLPA